jgi:hypothetical protein
VGSWALRSAASLTRRSGEPGAVSAGVENRLGERSPQAGHVSAGAALAIGRAISKTPHPRQVYS